MLKVVACKIQKAIKACLLLQSTNLSRLKGNGMCPANNQINIELFDPGDPVSIDILTHDGRLVLTEANFAGNRLVITKNILASGVYTVRVRNKGMVANKNWLYTNPKPSLLRPRHVIR